MKWIDVDGASLRYDLGGSGAETVVLVHEMGGMLESWDDTVPALQRHFRTLRYDQRGFGLSEKPRGALLLDDMVGDVLRLVDALQIAGRFHVIGAALGASIAMAVAARHPERVARLVVSSPVTGATAARKAVQEERARAVQRDGMRARVEQTLESSYPASLRGDAARFEMFRCRWLANDPHCYAAMDAMRAQMDLVPELARIQCPTLVLAGTRDTQRPPEAMKAIARAIPCARYAEIDSGHFMAVQTPELYLDQVLPFLLEP